MMKRLDLVDKQLSRAIYEFGVNVKIPDNVEYKIIGAIEMYHAFHGNSNRTNMLYNELKIALWRRDQFKNTQRRNEKTRKQNARAQAVSSILNALISFADVEISECHDNYGAVTQLHELQKLFNDIRNIVE